MKRLVFPLYLVGLTLFTLFALSIKIKGDLVLFATVFISIAVAYFSEMAFPYEKNIEKGTLLRDLGYIVLNITFLAIVGALTTRLFTAIMQTLLGRSRLFASEELGPVWVQLIVVIFGVELFRYFAHRAQHRSDFLWKFHAQHHSLKKTYSLNGYYSHPVDIYVRHALAAYLFLVIGFDPYALTLGLILLGALSVFSHCGADLEYGFFNRFLTTGQVHRWHHSAQFGAEGKNYSPSLALWDRVFGTYYFEETSKGPERMGLGADEAHYPVHSPWKLTWFPFRRSNY